jgi:small subunit ribosomal protein S9
MPEKVKKGALKIDKGTKKASKETKLKVASQFYYGTGKRKSAIAKVWIFEGTGKFQVNGKELLTYFGTDPLVRNVHKPFVKLDLDKKMDCVIRLIGGGICGQSDATKLGIARALLSMNESFRTVLKEEGYLTRDSRVKERKKYGRKKARKGFQYRKR